jgi:peptide/nickel transport system substrate-binding protein
MHFFAIFRQYLSAGLFAAILFSFCACANEPTGNATKVVTHELSDPTQLCPLNTTESVASNIMVNIFQPLLSVDYKTYQIVPILAKARPITATLPDGKVTLTFEIRPEAKWDDGSPITGEDVAFTLKVLRTPQTDNQAFKGYVQDIVDIQIAATNPRKFALVYDKPFMLAEQSCDFFIVPSYVYDAAGVLKKYTLAQMIAAGKALETDADLIKFANNYNSLKFKRETVVGSGPYAFKSWETNQRVTLVRKQNWWGDAIKDATNHYFQATPKTLVYETIGDMTTATVALKSHKLDVMSNIDAKDFTQDLTKSPEFMQEYNTFTPTMPVFSYIAINTRNPKLTDIKTRQALAQLMDVDQYIQSISYGLGSRAVSFIFPGMDKFRNNTLKPYIFDIEAAKKLLAEAGWADTNNDGILDKMINGKRTEFTLDINYNNGNKKREKISLILQDACKKAGIKVNILPLEFSVMVENLKKHNFELCVSAFNSPAPVEVDPYQLWHTESYTKGSSNYCGFGNADSDALIMQIRRELNEEKRIVLYQQLQAMVHEQVPVIFIANTKNAVAIHKKYKNVYESLCAPGYWMAGFGSAMLDNPN